VRPDGTGAPGRPLHWKRRQTGTTAVDRYEIELSNHFAIEEEVLFPLIEKHLEKMPIIAELISDHRDMEAMMAACVRTPRPSCCKISARVWRSTFAAKSVICSNKSSSACPKTHSQRPAKKLMLEQCVFAFDKFPGRGIILDTPE